MYRITRIHHIGATRDPSLTKFPGLRPNHLLIPFLTSIAFIFLDELKNKDVSG